MSASSVFPELPRSVFLPLLLLHIFGARAQELEIIQTQGPLMLTAGETLELSSKLIGTGPPGGVRWYKGSDRSHPPIYNDKGASWPRVEGVNPGSNTDYSIRIRNIEPKDAGTYYCVKYRAGIQGIQEFKAGKGTEVSVIGQQLLPSPGLWVGLFLNKIVAALFLSFLFLRKMLNKVN